MFAFFLLAVCTLDLRLPAGSPRDSSKVNTVVLHHTAVSTMGDSIRTLRLRGMSYHYLIDENGITTRTTPFERTAFQAAGANKTSVGIAFVGGAHPAWAPTEKQLAAAKQLIAILVRQHPGLHYLVGHGDIRDTNAGEPYGVDLDTVASELGLHHSAKDEKPLADYRRAAMELFVSPRTPRTPSRSTRFPDYESVTCPTEPTHIRYKVSTIKSSPP